MQPSIVQSQITLGRTQPHKCAFIGALHLRLKLRSNWGEKISEPTGGEWGLLMIGVCVCTCNHGIVGKLPHTANGVACCAQVNSHLVTVGWQR